jgi:hypothetical protein
MAAGEPGFIHKEENEMAVLVLGFHGGLIWLMGSVVYTGKDITEEPDAIIPHVGICLGAARATGSPTKMHEKI